MILSPGWTYGMGQGQFFFSEYGHVAFQIKLNHECSNMVENILPASPLPLTSGQNSTFLKHVAYQIKGNDACCFMVAKNFTKAPPPPPKKKK